MEIENSLVTIPLFCCTGWETRSKWGGCERWEIKDIQVPEDELLDKNPNRAHKEGGYFPVRFGHRSCYAKVRPGKDKPLEKELEGWERLLDELQSDDQNFWEHFLDENNFNKLIEFGTRPGIPSRGEMYSLLPPESINFNRLPDDYKITIHQKREMTIRADIHFGYQLENLQYLIKNAIKSIYIGALEYSGYKDLEDWNIVLDDITYTEHQLLGLELG